MDEEEAPQEEPIQFPAAPPAWKRQRTREEAPVFDTEALKYERRVVFRAIGVGLLLAALWGLALYEDVGLFFSLAALGVGPIIAAMLGRWSATPMTPALRIAGILISGAVILVGTVVFSAWSIRFAFGTPRYFPLEDVISQPAVGVAFLCAVGSAYMAMIQGGSVQDEDEGL